GRPPRRSTPASSPGCGPTASQPCRCRRLLDRGAFTRAPAAAAHRPSQWHSTPMIKGLFAGLAGLSAAVAVFQLQGDGGAGSAAPGGKAEADASIADRAGGPDAASSAAPGVSADASGPATAGATTPDARLRFPAARPDGGPVYL